MDKNTLNKLINLPGYVVEEVLEFTDDKICLLVRAKKNFVFICSYCGQSHTSGFHSTDIVIAEDQPISGRRVFLHIKKRKHRCPKDDKIHVEDTPWLKLFSRITNRYAEQISRLTAITTNQEAGWYLGLDDEVVYRIDKRCLEDQAKTKLNPIPSATHISVDEVSYRKYHRYLTNVIDTEKKVVVWNAKGRKSEILNKYYQGIGAESSKKIKSVALDGAKTYISSTTKYAINALIVYDKFHIVQKLNNTVDSVRKNELKKAKKEEQEEFIELMNCKQRFILLKNKNRLTEKQSNKLEYLCQLNKTIYKAMLLKEDFLQIYSIGDDIEKVENHLLNWISEAKNSSLEPFIALSESFLTKKQYILNWFKRKISSAISEGFNNKIKRLKRMAYGYRDIDYFRLKIHQHCGLLNPRFTT
ncbi:MAG: ISL3 family transposase [bacterium]|nr:ISL3 family transposase [bacterium]